MITLLKKILFHDKWNIGIANVTMKSLITGGEISEDAITWMPEKSGRYSADPFLFEYDGKLWLFFEDFAYKTNTAHLAVREVIIKNANVRFGETHSILDVLVHRSYPYVFAHGDSVYLIPEQCGTNSVVLYESVVFPYEWKERKVLLSDFAGVDATPFFYEEMWWMFVSEFGDKENEELNLYFTKNILQTEWQLHPQNPIVQNPRGARMAGNIFVDGDKIYRKGQDCSETYGGGLVLFQIDTLTQENYKETQIRQIQPPKKYSKGVHTISHCEKQDEYIAIDAKKWATPMEILRKLRIVLREKL